MGYVLIADDDEDFASAAAMVLRKAGHEVRIETNPSKVKALAEKRPPDLIVLDVMFPEDPSAGFELARVIRTESAKLRKVPLLMLTAVNTRFPLGFGSQDIDDVWMPVDAFLEKPVDLDVLKDRVGTMLAGGK